MRLDFLKKGTDSSVAGYGSSTANEYVFKAPKEARVPFLPNGRMNSELSSLFVSLHLLLYRSLVPQFAAEKR
jgi:hypothetical protein